MTRAPTPPTRASEETSDLPQIITIPEALSPMRGKGPERVLPFDFSKDSLVDSPTGVVATRLICNMVSDRDLPVLKGAKDSEAVGHFAANLTSVIRRLTRAHCTVKASRRNFDEAMGRHAEMVARLKELEALRAQNEGYFKDGFWGCLAQFRSNGYSEEEHPASFLDLQQAVDNFGDDDDDEDEEEQEEGEVDGDTEANLPSSPKPYEVRAVVRVAAAQRGGLEAELATEKEARAAETRAREALGAELERANARAERAKEDFLKSPEFDSLLAKKAWGYFKDGFWGCLAQFRSNGYSEEEHPASFLDLQQAVDDLGDDDDAEDEEEQEVGEVDGDTEANLPSSPKP
ncbi:hypothetical protein F511_43096 [Dorcoceras hygrometricum]|uniref:Uncharacterized protein n=1 Tax=Dorcoceras hygrometricum TaxID=472368 RepID=A0A2Z7BSY6_9LAMI|nr:hypothetical protein F511_43096 [Dorcoceras hygrometricum]